VNEPFPLFDGLAVGFQAGNVLLNGLTDIAPCFLDRGAVAEATGKRRAVGQVSGIFRLFFDHYLKAVKAHQNLHDSHANAA
jgi:hypothetical protein